VTARRARPSDVYHTRAKFKAVAECEHERCAWKRVPAAWQKDADTRREAKQHVLRNPGHEVVVYVRDVARYYLTDALVAELTADKPPASVDDRPVVSSEPQED
jgi:hypothetical protein